MCGKTKATTLIFGGVLTSHGVVRRCPSKLFKETAHNKIMKKVRPLKFEEEYGRVYFKVNTKYQDSFSNGFWRIPAFIPEQERGARLAAKSSHGVFSTEDIRNGIKVIVKPYVISTAKNQKIIREFDNITKAFERGISYVEPLAVMINQETKEGMIYTLARSKSLPLSSIKYYEIADEKRKTILHELARHLREWHAKRFVHNDAKLKNILYDTPISDTKLSKNEVKLSGKEGELQLPGSRNRFPHIHLDVVDLENSRFLDRSPNDEERGYDLATLVGDAVHHGLIQNQGDLSEFLCNYDGEQNEAHWMKHLKLRLNRHQLDKNIQNMWVLFSG